MPENGPEDLGDGVHDRNIIRCWRKDDNRGRPACLRPHRRPAPEADHGRSAQGRGADPEHHHLTQDHGVARQTAAKAVQLLESEGLVYRVPGLGYYVSELQ